MEAVAFQKRWENLGLQFLFAPVRFFVGKELPKGLHPEKRAVFRELEKFLEEVLTGIDHEEKGYASLTSLNSLIKAERAYSAIKPILSRNPNEAKADLNEIKRICQKIIEEGRCEPEEREQIKSFAHKALRHLDRERFELLRTSRPRI